MPELFVLKNHTHTAAPRYTHTAAPRSFMWFKNEIVLIHTQLVKTIYPTWKKQGFWVGLFVFTAKCNS